MTEHDEAKTHGQKGNGPADAVREQIDEITQVDWGRVLKSWSPFFIGLIGMMIIGWAIWPTLVYSKKEQPFNFNHVIHTEEVGMGCHDCHWFTDEGRFSGIPEARMCLDCHTWTNRQNEDSAVELAFLREFVGEDDELKKELTWYVYSKQPDCVYFSHIAHVKNGGFECSECHGDHERTAVLPPYYENRLTKYSRFVFENMKMTDCGDCHTKHDVPENNACFVCHK
jgi:menaquinone reductase, multiheme cytochrome c subunit